MASGDPASGSTAPGFYAARRPPAAGAGGRRRPDGPAQRATLGLEGNKWNRIPLTFVMAGLDQATHALLPSGHGSSCSAARHGCSIEDRGGAPPLRMAARHPARLADPTRRVAPRPQHDLSLPAREPLKLTLWRGAAEVAGGWPAWKAAGCRSAAARTVTGRLPKEEFDRIFSRVPRLTVELVINPSDSGVLSRYGISGPAKASGTLPDNMHPSRRSCSRRCSPARRAPAAHQASRTDAPRGDSHATSVYAASNRHSRRRDRRHADRQSSPQDLR